MMQATDIGEGLTFGVAMCQTADFFSAPTRGPSPGKVNPWRKLIEWLTMFNRRSARPLVIQLTQGLRRTWGYRNRVQGAVSGLARACPELGPSWLYS